MANIIKIPANTRARLKAIRDEAVDKFDVVAMEFEFNGGGSVPNDLLKVPANSQTYFTAIRDEVKDVFDVEEFTFPYGSEES